MSPRRVRHNEVVFAANPKPQQRRDVPLIGWEMSCSACYGFKPAEDREGTSGYNGLDAR